mmetsp:Transcript_16410/g.38465  ORF Transcript_16410/g.38465 Transcript_16410/m.38465 type:complete len:397 (+) Transcript_16410:83-1273(+)
MPPPSVIVSGKGLSLASLRRVRRLWQQRVQRLTLAELSMLGCGDGAACDNGLHAAQRTHRELKLRIAHRLRDFLFLPYKVMANPSVRLLYEKYVSAYNMHENFGSLDSLDGVRDYWLALARTFEEHQQVTRLLGHGRRQLVGLDPGLARALDAFLDRFFTSRIGTHLLGAHFLQRGPAPCGVRKPAGVAMGVLQPTSPLGFVRDLCSSLAASGRSSCDVPVDVEDAAVDTSILYIPAHLRVILREIMQNAMAATARVAQQRGADPVPIRVKVHRGQFGVFVTVSDQGGGIPRMEHIWNWGRDSEETPAVMTSTPPRGLTHLQEESAWPGCEPEDSRPAAVLPLGFGLPLARLTARYFGGDVRLQTLVGYGTNAYVHIPELQQERAVVTDDVGSRPF